MHHLSWFCSACCTTQSSQTETNAIAAQCLHMLKPWKQVEHWCWQYLWCQENSAFLIVAVAHIAQLRVAACTHVPLPETGRAVCVIAAADVETPPDVLWRLIVAQLSRFGWQACNCKQTVQKMSQEAGSPHRCFKRNKFEHMTYHPVPFIVILQALQFTALFWFGPIA